ncbi:hypothetical protein [Sporomusa aerivorans]|uniref:hypothetical protein n=1 Tax=Sporomusa aerivorans TaxID=204936 RepID=UPI00352A0BAE
MNTKNRLVLFGHLIVILVIALLVIGCGKSDAEKVDAANKLIIQNKFTEAVKELEDVKSPDAVKLKDELNKVVKAPYDTQVQILLLMTDEEIGATKNKTNTKSYLSNQYLNKYVLEQIANMDVPKVKEEAKKKFEQERKNALKEKFEKQHLSAWDGSNRALEKYIKNNMNDPKSYEHVETRYSIDYDQGIATVVTKFRGKNGFGGVVANACIAKQNIETGQLLEAQWVQ